VKNQMKTIAIITSQAFSLVNFRGPLIRELVARQVKVFALAPDFDDEQRRAILELGAQPVDFSLARTGMNPLRDGLDTIRLALLLRRLRPDVTLGYFIKPVIYGTLAAWVARVPRRVGMIEGLGYVFTPSGNSMTWRRQWLQRAVSGFYKLSLTKAHKAIFLNPDDINEFVGKGLVEENKAANLGGIGVDLDEWFPVPVVKKPMTFLLAARLLREKGIVEYAEAARRVKAIHPAARFVLLGGLDPNPGGLSRAEVESWVNEGLLEWPGHVPVKPWLAQASVYVLPSYYREGVPRSTQEAMAMGRPVITTDAPGCRETVVEGENGFLVPVRDPEALAKAMLRFIENPQLVETMGRASRALAERRFDVNKVNAKMLGWLGFV
jgi:glycosyltransferase involved in cell wall biosynthesis